MPDEHPTNPSEAKIGVVLILITFGYVLIIVLIDSIINKKIVISQNATRHLLDGLTLATGLTIGYAIFDSYYFKVVASNAIYTIVTAGSCILAPLINIMERYGRTLDH